MQNKVRNKSAIQNLIYKNNVYYCLFDTTMFLTVCLTQQFNKLNIFILTNPWNSVAVPGI